MYKAAVIGLGRMGSTFDDEIKQGGSIFLPYCHGPSYVASPHTELVAGADPHAEQGAIFAERWGLSDRQIYSDHRAMLEAERPDFVSVCTTARHRAAILLDAINAGVKAIWSEKPFTLSLAEADAVIEQLNEKNVALAINCSRRYNPFMSETRRMVEEGELGEILQITAYAHVQSFSHNGSHAIDAMRYLVGGDVEWVFGEMESDEKAAGEEDLMGNGYLAFNNGVRGFLRAMPTGLAPWEFDVIGTEGRVRSLAQGLEKEYSRWVPGGLRNQGVPARCALSSAHRTFKRHGSLCDRKPRASGRDRRVYPLHRLRTGARRWRSLSRCGSRTGRADAASICRSLIDHSAFCRSKSPRMTMPARIRRLQAANRGS